MPEYTRSLNRDDLSCEIPSGAHFPDEGTEAELLSNELKVGHSGGDEVECS